MYLVLSCVNIDVVAWMKNKSDWNINYTTCQLQAKPLCLCENKFDKLITEFDIA